MTLASVDGVPELVDRLHHASAGLLDLTDANRDIASTVTRAEKVPRASGALAASETVTVTGTGWGITYGKPYAVPVHWGTRYLAARPWLWAAAHGTEDTWMDGFTRHVQNLIDT